MEDSPLALAGADPLMIDYHDREWGVPLHDIARTTIHRARRSAGRVSWRTILYKREGYRRASPAGAGEGGTFDARRLQSLADPGIIRTG